MEMPTRTRLTLVLPDPLLLCALAATSAVAEHVDSAWGWNWWSSIMFAHLPHARRVSSASYCFDPTRLPPVVSVGRGCVASSLTVTGALLARALFRPPIASGYHPGTVHAAAGVDQDDD